MKSQQDLFAAWLRGGGTSQKNEEAPQKSETPQKPEAPQKSETKRSSIPSYFSVGPKASTSSSISSSTSAAASTSSKEPCAKKRKILPGVVSGIKSLVSSVRVEDRSLKLADNAFNSHHVGLVTDWLRQRGPPLLWIHGPTGCGKTYIVNQSISNAKYKAINIDIDDECYSYEHLLNLTNTREPTVFVLDNVSFGDEGLEKFPAWFLQLWKIDAKQKRPPKHYLPLIFVSEESYHAKFKTGFFNKVDHFEVNVGSPAANVTKSLLQSMRIPSSLAETYTTECGCNWHRLRHLIALQGHGSTYLGDSSFEQFRQLWKVALDIDKWVYIWQMDKDAWWGWFISNVPQVLGGKQLETIVEYTSFQDVIPLDIRDCIFNYTRLLPVALSRTWDMDARIALPTRIQLPEKCCYAKQTPRKTFENDIYALRMFRYMVCEKINKLIKTPKKEREKREDFTLQLLFNEVVLRRGELTLGQQERLVLENPDDNQVKQVRDFMEKSIIKKCISLPVNK
jgi:hypothetical protein